MTIAKDMEPTAADRSLRFLFEHADIRGEMVHLDQSFIDIVSLHQYGPSVSRLMGELLCAAALLSATLKFNGKLILQITSEGQIPLIMAECTDQLTIRAIARGAEQATSEEFSILLTGGQLAITIDPNEGERYQGIVELCGDSIAESIEAYFAQSEQLQTKLWLAADQNRAGGMLLQQLPEQISTDTATRSEHWNEACALAATLDDQELVELSAETLIHRLFHENPVRVFEPTAVAFNCSCSRDRTFNALASLGSEELKDILVEQGSIAMDCEFCNQQYVFEPKDLEPLLSPDEGRTLH